MHDEAGILSPGRQRRERLRLEVVGQWIGG
jgi:hypothetical protein